MYMWCVAVKNTYELLNADPHPHISHYHAIAVRPYKTQLCVVLQKHFNRL